MRTSNAGWAAFRAYLRRPSVCSASTYDKYAYAAQPSECLGMHRNSTQPRVTGYTVIR